MTRKDRRKVKDKRKEQKREKQNNEALLHRRDVYKRIISIVGADAYYAQLPPELVKLIYSLTYPNIDISIDNTTNIDINVLNYLRDIIKERYNSTEIQLADSTTFKLSDTCALYVLQQLFSSLYINIGSDLKRSNPTNALINKKFGITQPLIREDRRTEIIVLRDLIKNIVDRLNNFIEVNDKTCFEKTLAIAYEEVTKLFNYSNGICPIVTLTTDSNGRVRPSIKIKTIQPKLSNIRIDGDMRKVYRCHALIHSSNYPDGVIPITLEPNIINNKEPLDVYIQDHALTRIRERLDINPMGYVYDCIGRSMLKPVVAGMSGPSYMIEYRYFSHKVGYLIVTVENNIALIRSFKFITMTGTPEFYALRKRLGGSREDFEYLGLDTIDTLLNSDIQNDPKLRVIFEQCGLGHLFGLINLDNAKEVASEIRKYFRLK